MDRTKKDEIYSVVINHEEQYSIWLASCGKPPSGWSETGKTGSKDDCLRYIKEVWTDMRPLSLQKEMQERLKKPTLKKP